MKFGRMQIGLLVTALYAGGVVALVASRWPCVKAMPLNELGDFAAGAAGPIAFLWLVLGYFQQGDELTLNTRALNDQKEELRQSVLAQESLASAMREQNALTARIAHSDGLRRKRLIQPAFSLEIASLYSKDALLTASLRIFNHGADCRELFIDVLDNDESNSHHGTVRLTRNEKLLIDVAVEPGRDHDLTFTFIYLDQESDRQEQTALVHMQWVGPPERFEFYAPSQTTWQAGDEPAESAS